MIGRFRSTFFSLLFQGPLSEPLIVNIWVTAAKTRSFILVLNYRKTSITVSVKGMHSKRDYVRLILFFIRKKRQPDQTRSTDQTNEKLKGWPYGLDWTILFPIFRQARPDFVRGWSRRWRTCTLIFNKRLEQQLDYGPVCLKTLWISHKWMYRRGPHLWTKMFSLD